MIKNVFELPCMLDMYGLFYLTPPPLPMCLKMSFFCRMTPAWHSHFIYELLTFSELQPKSDRTPPHAHTTPLLSLSLSLPRKIASAAFKCAAVARLCAAANAPHVRPWWKLIFGGSWCEGEGGRTERKNRPDCLRNLLGSLVCCLKPLFLFKSFFSH